MLHLPLVFLDLETTGATATHDRITEVGLVEIENGEFKESWSQLVNPEIRIPPFIEQLTGITSSMVKDQPTFAEIASGLYERLAGKVLVAHNARFDYGFLRNEFQRAGLTYKSKTLCTAKLSRALFTEYRRHNLDALIERYGLSCTARHRALGDAEVLWEFTKKIHGFVDQTVIAKAVQAQFATPSLPAGLTEAALQDLPEAPGVYLFYGENDLPLYVGKSVDLYARVRSHFSGDHRSAKDMRISQEVTRLEWTQTAGELGALLKEARLIKELLPSLNRMERRQSGFHGYEWDGDLNSRRPLKLVESGREQTARLEKLHGLFRSKRMATDALTQIAREHGLCPALLDLEPRRAEGAPCFAHQLKHCKGACCGKESVAQHNTRLLAALQSLRMKPWPYRGAIGVREKSGDRQEIHLFDRWCYLGTAHTEPELYEKLEVRAAPLFDLDIYKIMQRALMGKKRKFDVLDLGPMSSLWYREEARAVA
jgi:DNA polymerase-3 subunit epsilon